VIYYVASRMLRVYQQKKEPFQYMQLRSLCTALSRIGEYGICGEVLMFQIEYLQINASIPNQTVDYLNQWMFTMSYLIYLKVLAGNVNIPEPEIKVYLDCATRFGQLATSSEVAAIAGTYFWSCYGDNRSAEKCFVFQAVKCFNSCIEMPSL